MSSSFIKGHRFQPFPKKQPAKKPKALETTTDQSAIVSGLQSSPLLDYLGYRFNTVHSIMICVACECAVLPGNAIAHVKNQHNIQVAQEQVALWNDTVEEWGVIKDLTISLPHDRQPVELLKLHPNAFCCNHCPYVCLTKSTFSKHWGKHKDVILPLNERYHEGWAQTFYSQAPCIYFEVDVPVGDSTPLFDVYMKKEIPNYPSFDIIIPTAPREIPPLLYCTRWHEHLEEYMMEKSKRRQLHTLAHPKMQSKDRLWVLVLKYMETVAEVSKNSSMRVRCLLTEYPRTDQKVDPWKYHLTKDTQKQYAYPLHSLAYSILESHKGHPTHYKFPLPPQYVSLITALEPCLQDGAMTDQHIVTFHNFIYPLLSSQPSISEDNKWSMVIECWLALYALEIEGSFSDASGLTGILAKLEYHCRAATFFQGYLHRGEFPDESLYLAVEHFCNLNIRTGGLHPFNTIVEYQRFASTLAYANASPPITTLSADAKSVTYKDKTMHLDDWIAGMRRAYDEAVQLTHHLCRKMDFTMNLSDDLADDMSEKRYGYSWLDSVRSPDSTALIKHLLSNTEGDVPCKMGRGETLIWDAAWQLSWMRTAGQLNQLLANLHHTVPGQPSRIAELCDFRLRNGLRGRNIFYNHGDIWLITRRVKSESLIQHEEFIPVKLPPELCELYKIYLIVIRPVEIDFARRLWGTSTAALYHEYLYVMDGGRLLEDRFYIQFKRWTEAYFKCPLGVRGYRQSIIVVARAYLGTEYELELEEEDDALIKQRCHGPIADRRCYGVQSKYLTTLSSDLMFRFGHMSEWWWRLTQFAPGKEPLLPLDLRRSLQSGDAEVSNNTSAVIVRQDSWNDEKIAAMVSASVASAVRSLKDEMNNIIQTSVAAGIAEALTRHIANTRTVSQCSTVSTVTGDVSMDVLPTPPQMDPIIPATLNDPQAMDIDSDDFSQKPHYYLRLLYKDKTNPQFRSKGQQKMVEMAFSGTQNFVGVLPTGGGKSLVFLLPALAATMDTPQSSLVQKTLVIIPNKSLMDDTIKRATNAGISCSKWTVNTSDTAIKDTALILIAIESLDSYKFKLWYRNNEKAVKRFVVDECHQVITCDSYRHKFNAVKELAQYPVQKIFITATLPVFLEDYFLQQVYLPRSTPVIREPTNRTNIIYHVLRVEQRVRKARDVIIDLTKLVERDLWTAASRGIIFCLSRPDVDELASLFGNTKSHSDMESAIRSELQEKWNQGLPGHRWMVATTGFIHGIDNANVDTVIFLEMPYGLNNFIQGGGRAGRSGQSAHVFLLDYCSNFLLPPFGIDYGAVAAGADFVGNVSDCRREIISDVMDGNRVRCGDLPNAEPCDICNPDSSMVKASKRLLLPIRNDTPDFDQEFWDDVTLASLDDSFFTAPPFSSFSSSSPSSAPVASSSTTHTRPSMSLLVDQAIYLKLKQDKVAKVAELTALTKAIGGISDGSHTRYCVICWVWKSKRQIKTPAHQYFVSCMSKEDRFVSHALGWITFKKRFRFEQYRYCYKCGLPQGDFTPSTHPTFKAGTHINCPFDDLVVLLIWFIIHTEDIWRKACSVFSGITATMSLENITKWIIAVEQPHLFYNGLELVIWYWTLHKEDLLNT